MKAYTWDDLYHEISPGGPIKYWSPLDGYTGGTFTVTALSRNKLRLTTKSGKQLEVRKSDFEKVTPITKIYASRKISSQQIENMSGRRYYIFSLQRELHRRESEPENTVADILTTTSRIFLKSEYGPVSELWPAVSFSQENYAKELGRLINPEADLVLFAGTQNDSTPPQMRGKLLCASRVRAGNPVDSALLVDHDTFAKFQASAGPRFAYSLPVTDAWEFPDLPGAKTVLGKAYSRIGQGNRRSSWIELSRKNVERVASLAIRRVPLVLPPLENFEISDTSNILEKELSRILALMSNRAQRGGSERTRREPIREVAVSQKDLRALWEAQQGRCKLCAAPIPLGTSNFLLSMSADRIDSQNPRYDPDNTQLTHCGCNLGKNEADVATFNEWLSTVRSCF